MLPAPIIGLDDSLEFCLATTTNLDAGIDSQTYVWSSGETTQIIEITGNGLGLGIHEISVIATDANGCVSHDTIYLRVEECLGMVEKSSAEHVSVYPNPSSSLLYIDFGDGVVPFQIVDLTGLVIFSSDKNSDSKVILDVSN